MENKNTVKVYTKPNGPIIITGKILFENENGEIKEAERLVLCRCGASSIMPLCDASHNRIGFQSK